MKRITIFAMLQLFLLLGYGQMQQGFKYQAEVRNAAGTPLAEQPLSLRIALESTTGGEAYYTEVHELTTNKFGLISIVIGEGTVTYGSISEIPWEEGNVTLKAEIKLDGQADFSTLGQSVLYPVPYALYAASGAVTPGTLGQTLNHDGTGWVANSNIFNADANVGIGTVTPTEKLEVMGNIKAHGKVYGDNIEINQPSPMEDPIFVVRNSLGKIVFAVYESGVRMYVDDTGKGRRGGFAVGGFSDQTKEEETEYFRVTPDSVRVNVRNDAGTKGRRGGFAVGGFSDQTKLAPSDLLYIAPDSARIYINDSNTKGRRGGFAVGGFSDQTKQGPSNFLDLTADNYFIGHNAGMNTTIGVGNQGKYNSFMGYESGLSNTTGYVNTFMGYKTGRANTTGASNVFIGNNSGLNNTSGGSNVFIGNESGFSNTTGFFNTFMGYKSGQTNTIGASNVFIGHNSGFSNENGLSNVFIGKDAGLSSASSNSNVFIGESAGKEFDGNFGNVFIGQEAANRVKGGHRNVMIGYRTGSQPKDEFISYGNVFLGALAGNKISGNYNVMIGESAGENYQEGDEINAQYNVFLGKEAGQHATGNNNVYIGNGAGAGEYNNLNTGSRNIFIGDYAGKYEMSDDKLYIANSSTSSPLIYGDFSTQNLVINGNSTNNTNNRTFFTNGSAGGTTVWNNDSDAKLKKDIITISNPIEKVQGLRGVSYRWKDNREEGVRIGFIAQEAMEVLPEVVTEGETYSMQYAPITALLVEAIKEQQQQIKSLEQRNVVLETKIRELESLKAEIEKIKALINKQ